MAPAGHRRRLSQLFAGGWPGLARSACMVVLIMRRPSGTVAAATLALFFALCALLVFQLRSGRDPALGRGAALAQATAPAPKRVLIRKVIVTRVVHDAPRAQPAPAAVQRAS